MTGIVVPIPRPTPSRRPATVSPKRDIVPASIADFPTRSSSSLTVSDFDALTNLAREAPGAWVFVGGVCEDGDAWGSLVTHSWGDGEAPAFMVWRQRGRIVVTDHRRTEDFGGCETDPVTIGRFLTMADATHAVLVALGAGRSRPP